MTRSPRALALSAVAILASGAVLCSARPASAQLLVTLNSPTQVIITGGVGGSTNFTGTIQNFTSSAVTVNGASFFFPTNPNSSLNASNLFSLPLTINANSTFSGNLFSVSAAGNTPDGSYAGAYTLTDTLGNAYDTNFNVNVIVPAPPAPLVFGAMMGIGSAVTALTRRRRRATGASAVDTPGEAASNALATEI